ncbi:YdcF family protein [Leifsonia sp. McL0607]|uniref:YdcF family protein n=1 Tax=Leifsonia sp. McL0607 TaxID=3415672 RepID=UPI003CF5C500
MSLLFTVTAALAFIVVAVRMWRTDNRRLSIGVIAAIGGYFAIESLLVGLEGMLPAAIVFTIPLTLLPLLILVLAAYLIANGLRMLRRESRSLANGLSLIAGVALLAVPVLTYLALTAMVSTHDYPIVLRAALAAVIVIVALGSTYVAAFFVLFLVYGLVYRHARVGDYDAIVVLGAGLIDGRVPPLLGARLDRGSALFSARRSTGDDCVLIPTGGRGSDEPRSEGEAMAEYLRDAGVPADRVLAETEAVNTEQNLLLSREIAEAHRPGSRVLIVTSGYHVLRAAMLARRVGLPAAATGAKTARYFVPSATLREFAAVAVMFPRIQKAAAALCVLAGLGAGAILWLADAV